MKTYTHIYKTIFKNFIYLKIISIGKVNSESNFNENLVEKNKTKFFVINNSQLYHNYLRNWNEMVKIFKIQFPMISQKNILV